MIETIWIGTCCARRRRRPTGISSPGPPAPRSAPASKTRSRRSDCLTALLDFSDVELLDFSCADEIVAKLLLAHAAGRPRFLVLRGLREDQHDAINHVLTHHRLAIAALVAGDGARVLLGWVSADARAAFACVSRLRPRLRRRRSPTRMGWPEERGQRSAGGPHPAPPGPARRRARYYPLLIA